MKKNTLKWRIIEPLRGSEYSHLVVRTVGNRSIAVGRFGTCLGNEVVEADGIQEESLNGADHLLPDLAGACFFHPIKYSNAGPEPSADTRMGSAAQGNHSSGSREATDENPCCVTGPYLTAGILARVETSLSRQRQLSAHFEKPLCFAGLLFSLPSLPETHRPARVCSVATPLEWRPSPRSDCGSPAPPCGHSCKCLFPLFFEVPLISHQMTVLAQ